MINKSLLGTLGSLTLFVSMILVLNVTTLRAQQGTISGVVVDAETGEELIGATVQIQGTTTGNATDVSGNYQFSVDPGTYSLQFSYVSYSPKTVEGVEVKAGEITRIDMTLQSEDVQLDEIVVQAEQINNNEVALLKLQKKSLAVQDGISIDQIRRIGASNSAESMKNVTGASVEEGKYVVIRGLGDRYSSTQLNGVSLPSTDPYRNTASMDLVPTNIVENIVTQKTFTPDKPGSFTGGNVDVTTRSIPEQFFLSAKVSLSYNTQSTFQDILTDPLSSGTDWLGYGREVRALPSFLDSESNRKLLSGAPTLIIKARRGEGEESQQARSYINGGVAALEDRPFIPATKPSFLNHSFNFAVGDRLDIGGNNFGYTVGLNFQRDYTHYPNRVLNQWEYPASGNDLQENLNTRGAQSSENPKVGAFVSLAYQLDNRNEIKAIYTYNNDTDISAGALNGTWPGAISGSHGFFTNSISYVQRTINNAQLEGKHTLGQRNMQLSWVAGYTSSDQYEPDTRVFAYDIVGGSSYQIRNSEYDRPFHFFRDLQDDQLSGKIDLDIPLGEESQHRIKIGGYARQKDRDFEEFRFQIDESGLNYPSNQYTTFPRAGSNGDISQFFAPGNLGVLGGAQSNGFYPVGPYFTDQTESSNIYTGTEQVLAGYVMGVYQASEALKFIGGVRAETTDITVTSSNDVSGSIDELDFLPALSVVYALNEDANIRLAGSRTLARPNMREIAPFSSFDFIGGFIYRGNPELERTLVLNADARYEWFPNPGELIAVSAFYKQFDNPIQQQLSPVASGGEVTFVNTDEATLYGVELEVRKKLGFVGGTFWENMEAGINFTYTQSSVAIDPEELEARRRVNPTVEDTRPFQAQSPYLANLNLTYYDPESELEATIYANVFGRRLYFNGFGGVPDVYEIYGDGNSPTPDLRFTVSKRLFNNFSVGFKAENILNYEVQRNIQFPDSSSEYFVQEAFSPGRSFSLSVGYSIQ